MRAISLRAESWAVENGLVPPLSLSAPSRIDFPRFGHGYLVGVQEKEGKRRMASAQFTDLGVPSFWTMDGKGASA